MRWLALVLCVFLLSCQGIEPVPYKIPPDPIKDDLPARPDIPRSEVEEPPIPAGEQPSGGQPVLIHPDIIPHLSLEVPISERIGKHHPVITSSEFPLLRHDVVPLSSGTYASYDELLIFDFEKSNTGRIIFGQDEIDESISTFLFFEEDKPILEYRVELHGYAFWDILGKEIQLLGHKYLVAEATETSVSFFGVDIDSNLHFSDGKKLFVGNEKQPNTETHVHPDSVAYRLYTKGDDSGNNILLSPGESITENIRQDRLASRLLDIRYEGVPDFKASHIRFNKLRFGYELEYDDPEGRVTIPLVEEDGGQLVLGKLGERLRIDPCKRREFCIAPGDLVLLPSPDGRTFVMSYSDVSEDPDKLIMRTRHNRYSYEFLGRPGKNAFTEIIIDDIAFGAWIGPRDNETGAYNISIDIPHYREHDIIVDGGFRVRLHEIVDNKTLPLEIIVPRELTLDRREEHTHVNITFDGEWVISVDHVGFYEDENTKDTFGQTEYGAVYLLDTEKRNLEANEGEELDILLPREQIFGRIRLEG